MARGYPDFFGYQIVPKYGTPHEEYDSSLIASLGNDTIHSITGKGRSYGGFLYIFGTGLVSTSITLTVTLDGVPFAFESPQEALDRGNQLLPNQFLSLVSLRIIDAGEYINYKFVPDWTFGQSIVVHLTNGTAANIQVYSRFYWGQVI